ncbi:MAG TPA: hypothetical protein VGS57_19520 [Thermoanaerobaculia bacterium]|nr:hypothetical protein [Thermoanaerobaculia bacterium]
MSVPTRTLMRLHRYAGLIVAPMVLFFAVSGTWQEFRLQQDRKDGSYKAPPALAAASDFHKAEDLPRGAAASLLFKLTMSAVAGALALSTLLGIVVALRVTRPRWLALALLLFGAVVPPLLYVLAR